jgi:flagellar biosynthesis protein FlhG
MSSRVISFASGKGGVGKTALVSNLGHLWANEGKRTLLVDADWSLGKLSIAMGAKPKWTLENVLSGELSLEGAITELKPNLSLLASPSGVLGLEELSPDQRKLLFYELDALGSLYDFILLDHSSGISLGVLEFAAASHQHVIVTTPEPTSYTDAYAIMKILSKRYGINEFWLLITMSRNASDTQSVVARFSNLVQQNLEVKVNFLGAMPWDAEWTESIRKQTPLVEWNAASGSVRHLQDVRKSLANSEPKWDHGLKFFYESQFITQRDKLCQL